MEHSLADDVVDSFSKLYICGYAINTDLDCPFLEYGLLNGERFPSFETHIHNGFHARQIGDAYWQITHNVRAMCKGFLVYNKELYIFYQLDTIVNNGNIIFCLVDEIMNTQTVYGRKIDISVVRLFVDNIGLLLLMDQSGKPYETPVAGYVKCTPEQMSYIDTFGISKATEREMFGANYYFISRIEPDDSVVRFAIFLGKVLVKRNLIEDPSDDSEIRAYMISEKLFTCTQDYLAHRISDYAGTWTANYDSVCLGQVELDDGSQLKQNIIAVKSWSQFVLL